MKKDGLARGNQYFGKENPCSFEFVNWKFNGSLLQACALCDIALLEANIIGGSLELALKVLVQKG